jgi:phosphoglycolate phosphatase-like HAD superfamily hydrolase
MIKGIIFDLDGTLVRLPIRYNIIFDKLKILFDTKDEFKPLIPTILTKAKNDVNLIQQAFDLICDEETIAAKNFEVIENAVEILDHFKNENISLGLVTMQCKKATKLVLDSMNISNHFSSMITRDDSHERTIQIKKSVEFLSLSPQEIVVIGDRIHDINSAKQIGCSAILSNKNKLDSFKVSPVISELLELKKINFSKI